MLAHGRMPVGTVAETAIMGRKVEAIDFGITLLVGIVGGSVQGLLGGTELLACHHATAEEDNLGLGIVTAYLLVKLLETLEKQERVCTLSRGIVSAQVDAHHVGCVACEIPLVLVII